MGIGTAFRRRLGRLEPRAADLYRRAFIDLDALATTLTSLVAALPARRVLEVGCGEGALAARLVAAMPDAAYVGIDPSPAAGRLYEGDPARATFRTATVDQLAAEAPEPFDLVVVNDVLHHVPPDKQRSLLAEAAGLARRGGIVAVKDWEASRQPGTVAALLADRYVTGDRGVRFFAIDDLRTLVADAVGTSELVLEARVPPRPGNVLLARRIS